MFFHTAGSYRGGHKGGFLQVTGGGRKRYASWGLRQNQAVSPMTQKPESLYKRGDYPTYFVCCRIFSGSPDTDDQ